jgi:hypothetical protein
MRVRLKGFWELGEGDSEPFAQRFCHPDVALRGREIGVSGAVLDLERVIAADGHPRDARGSQVVERHGLAGTLPAWSSDRSTVLVAVPQMFVAIFQAISPACTLSSSTRVKLRKS